MIRVGLDFEDREFARSFADSMSRWFDISFGNDGDMVISDREGSNDLVLVTDRNCSDESHIYMFEGAERIRKKIIHGYELKNGDRAKIIGSSDAVITGVCESGGGSGATTVALSYARIISGRSIYVSFDDIPYEGSSFNDAPFDVNRLLFDLKCGINVSADSVTYEDKGVFHLRYHRPYNLLNMISYDDILIIIRSLTDSFDNVILDFGNRYDMNVSKLINLCSSLIFVENESSGHGRYEEYVLKSYEGRIKHVRNMVSGDNGDLFDKGNQFIPYIRDRKTFEYDFDGFLSDIPGII